MPCVNSHIDCYVLLQSDRYRSITKQFFRRVDGVVVIYDITVEESFRGVRPWLSNIKEAVGDDIPVMVLGNKVDMESEREVSQKDGQRLAEVWLTVTEVQMHQIKHVLKWAIVVYVLVYNVYNDKLFCFSVRNFICYSMKSVHSQDTILWSH